jgi:hypothetical protein
MDMRFDHDSWQGASRDSRDKTGAARSLDWRLLAIRLAAGHAFQRSLAEGDAAWMEPMGSFDPVAARRLIDYAAAAPTDWGFDFAPEGLPFPVVNPVTLGDIKFIRGNESIVAGPIQSGDRGLK